MTTTPSSSMTALDVACAICDAQPGRPCRTVVNIVNGQTTREVRLVHGYRVHVVEQGNG
jgi:hypothetical protein